MYNIDEDVSLDKDLSKKLKKSNNKSLTIFNILLIIAIFIGLLIYMILVDGIDNILLIINSVDYFWVFMGVICMLLSWLFEAICLHIPIKKIYPTQKFHNSFRIMMLGQLFNNITPFCSGRATNASILYA